MISINNLFVILLLLLVNIIDGSLMPFEDCGSVHILESIDIPSCSAYPCHVKIGSLVNVTTTVLVQRPTFDSTELIQKAYFVVNTIIIEANVTPDLCSAIRTINSEKCRFRNGARFKYEASVTVTKLPPIRAQLWWIIKRSNGEIEICYRMTVMLE